MEATLSVLAIADDPLVRKALTESVGPVVPDTHIETVPPTRATADRMAAMDTIMLVIRGTDPDALRRTASLIGAAARPTLVVAIGADTEARAIAAKLGIPADLMIALPDLDIRTGLAQAAPRLAQGLRRARDRGAPVAPPTTGITVEPDPSTDPQPLRTGASYLGTVICIGASTGGTEALETILAPLPLACPPIVIVQHMPGDYTGGFAVRLNHACAIDVVSAHDDIPLRRGLAVVAPGGRQLRLLKDSGGIWTRAGEPERIGGHCPSVDVLMTSAAEELGSRAIGIVLTGMGRDGAAGLLAMRRAGARTVAQDEASSTVYGMPKAAAEEGAAARILPLEKMADWIAGQSLSTSL